MDKKDAKIFLQALDQLEKEKGISKENLLIAVEQALLAAYKKTYGDEENVVVELDRKTGDVGIYEIKTVVKDEDLYDAAVEISLGHALELQKSIKGKRKPKLGDTIEIEVNCDDFRRNAIQNAKQIIIQKVREAERENMFDKFKEREFDIINGIIRRIDDRGNVYIEFDGTEAVLTPNEQSPADTYRIGERLKVYLSQVERATKFPKIIISRKNDGLLKKLFELEIPEISAGIIEVKGVARDVGRRAKVAVNSLDPNIDTVGACIGQKGMRIRNIVNELNGEKIDIVIWKDSKEEFVSAVLSPATVKSVEIIEDENTARVIVDNSQLSLAIGKSGQNAKLAARLTGMRVDIKTEEQHDKIKEEILDEAVENTENDETIVETIEE